MKKQGYKRDWSERLRRLEQNYKRKPSKEPVESDFLTPQTLNASSFENNFSNCASCPSEAAHKGFWETFGISPFLDAEDYPDNYIRNADGGVGACAVSEFEDLVGSPPTIVNAKLNFRHRVNQGYQYCVDLWDGSSWNRILSQTNTSGWETKTIDVTSYLDTPEKVNNAKVKLGHAVGGGYGIFIDRIWLLVEVA